MADVYEFDRAKESALFDLLGLDHRRTTRVHVVPNEMVKAELVLPIAGWNPAITDALGLAGRRLYLTEIDITAEELRLHTLDGKVEVYPAVDNG